MRVSKSELNHAVHCGAKSSHWKISRCGCIPLRVMLFLFAWSDKSGIVEMKGAGPDGAGPATPGWITVSFETVP